MRLERHLPSHVQLSGADPAVPVRKAQRSTRQHQPSSTGQSRDRPARSWETQDQLLDLHRQTPLGPGSSANCTHLQREVCSTAEHRQSSAGMCQPHKQVQQPSREPVPHSCGWEGSRQGRRQHNSSPPSACRHQTTQPIYSRHAQVLYGSS